MAKKSVIARQVRREKIVKKYAARHKELQSMVKSKSLTGADKESAMKKLRALPRDAHAIRLRRRCAITGRPRGVYRRFGICRIKIRELMALGQLAGLLKSSW